MGYGFEESKKNLIELCSWEKKNVNAGNRNEASTRLHLIDDIFLKCLGWQKTDCVAEDAFEGTYTDYTFGFPAKLMVVEAKREGVYFELPIGFDKKICDLETIIDGNEPIAAAVNQCSEYCQKRGISVGVVCNGHQIIAFVGSRVDGIPPIEGRALVLTSLQDAVDNFRLLWDNLSKDGIHSCKLQNLLRVQIFQPPPPKLAKSLHPYPGLKNRNPLQTQLKMLADLYLEDVMNHPEIEESFLAECYCQGGALSQYALISKHILETRYSLMLQEESEETALEKVHKKSGLTDHLSVDVLQASLSRRPIILLGDVGVGKTTFLKHFIHIDAKDILKNAISLYVDFGREPALTDDLYSHVINSCESQLLQSHGVDIQEGGFVRGVYHSDLQRFSKGIYGGLKETSPEEYKLKELALLEERIKDKPEHLQNCLDHISRGHKKQIVLILDNVDQRPFDFQEKVFLVAESLAAKWPVTIFVALRPETFYKSKSRGTLTAYQTRVFTISPPRVDLVVLKRLRFALKQLTASQISTLTINTGGLQVNDLENYFKMLLDSFERSEELKELIDNLSQGNIRAALAILNSFIGSGHVDTVKILKAINETGRYWVPLHEFMRAVIFGDYEHYDSESNTPIANLFDIATPDGREHFLLPVILAQIEQVGATSGTQGFVEALKVFSYCQSLGFHANQIQEALSRACEKKLLETSPRFEAASPATQYRITTTGAYHYKKIVGNFTYIDAMIVDTPIVDEAVRGIIYDAKFIDDRLNQAEIICEYLDKQWEKINGAASVFNWKMFSLKIGEDIQAIRSRRAVTKIESGEKS